MNKFPYIAESSQSKVPWLIYSESLAICLGHESHSYKEINKYDLVEFFSKNITAEYLANTKVKVESEERESFIFDLIDDTDLVCEVSGSYAFIYEHFLEDLEREITIPLPPKEATMSKVQINVNNNTDSIVQVTKSDDESNIFIHVNDLPKDGGGNMKPTGIVAAAMRTLIDLKYTYHGGEMWKPPLGNAIEKSKEWPQVGEVVIYETDDKPMSHEDCNLGEHCIVDTWKSGDELSVIAIVSKHGKSMPVVQNKRTQEVSTILIELIKKPPTPEEELTQALKNYASSHGHICEWKYIARSIINGEIEGLEYKPQ